MAYIHSGTAKGDTINKVSPLKGKLPERFVPPLRKGEQACELPIAGNLGDEWVGGQVRVGEEAVLDAATQNSNYCRAVSQN